MGNFSFDEILDAIASRVAERLQVSGRAEGTDIQPRLLTISKAAAYLNRSSHSVRHLVATKKLRSVRLDGRVYLDIRDLDAAIEDAKE